MLLACALLTAITSAWTVLSIVALLRPRRPPAFAEAEPITILKPLRGSDPQLEDNLRSFFEQDYRPFDLVFGVEGTNDAALSVVERLRAQYPKVASRIVVHEGGAALNPKVRNLLAMLAHGSHDIVVISDSNIRVQPDYLSTSLATLQQPGTGLVTHPIAGTDGRSLGAAIERSYLGSNVIAGIVTASEMFGHASAIGKSMMFRLSELDAIGGMESLSSVLAEDYVMGRMFQHAGYRVALADAPVLNTCEGVTLRGTFDRMVRWAMMRARVQPLAYLLEPLSSPLVILGLLLALPTAPSWPLAALVLWTLLLIAARDLAASRRLGQAFKASHLLLAPLRDLVWLCAWLTALGRRHVSWRGHRLRVSAGTRLYQVQRS